MYFMVTKKKIIFLRLPDFVFMAFCLPVSPTPRCPVNQGIQLRGFLLSCRWDGTKRDISVFYIFFLLSNPSVSYFSYLLYFMPLKGQWTLWWEIIKSALYAVNNKWYTGVSVRVHTLYSIPWPIRLEVLLWYWTWASLQSIFPQSSSFDEFLCSIYSLRISAEATDKLL